MEAVVVGCLGARQRGGWPGGQLCHAAPWVGGGQCVDRVARCECEVKRGLEDLRVRD